jgi:hypothetical protein
MIVDNYQYGVWGIRDCPQLGAVQETGEAGAAKAITKVIGKLTGFAQRFHRHKRRAE